MGVRIRAARISTLVSRAREKISMRFMGDAPKLVLGARERFGGRRKLVFGAREKIRGRRKYLGSIQRGRGKRNRELLSGHNGRGGEMAWPLVSESPSPKSTECAFWRGETAKSLFCSPLLLSPWLLPRPRIFRGARISGAILGRNFWHRN